MKYLLLLSLTTIGCSTPMHVSSNPVAGKVEALRRAQKYCDNPKLINEQSTEKSFDADVVCE